MTQEQLDRLPIVTGPLYQGDDDVFLIRDRAGRWWTTGWVGDTLCKQEAPPRPCRLPEPPCPKCGEAVWRVSYRPEMWSPGWLDMDEAKVCDEHLAATCRNCGYTKRMPCKDRGAVG